MKNLALILFSFLSIFAIAQPANDVCSGATTSPQNGSCLAGTTTGAGDHWIGTVGCAGNNPEVWYTFVATGTQASFTLTAGTMGGNIELILVAATGACSGLSVAGSVCAPSVLTTTIATIPGTTYYYTISSTGALGTFTTCVLSSTPPPAAGQNCSNAATVCTNAPFGQGTSNAGIGAQEVTTGNSCWGSGGERQSKWYKFSVGCSGTLCFRINPTVASNDYDWAVWNITGDPGGCTTKGNSIACNWSGCTGSTGLSSCPASEPGVASCGGPPSACSGTCGSLRAWGNEGAPSGCAGCGCLNVVAGQVYGLLIDNFTTSNSGFNFSFGGACGMTAVIGPNAAFTGTITDTPSPCLNLAVTKTCPISPTTNSTYLWNFGDGFTATTMNASHTYSVAGNYNVSLTVTDLLGCSITTSQAFNIGCVPLPVELVSFTATKAGGSNLLEWTTATEKNNSAFILEKSSDALNFTEFKTIPGAGNSNATLKYSAVDNAPYYDITYYRLKTIDGRNKSEYSHVIAVKGDGAKKDDFKIVPNPSSQDEVVLKYNCTTNSKELVNIYDSKGLLVLSKIIVCEQGQNNTVLNIGELPSGLYFVSLNTADGFYKTRLVKN